MEVYKWKLLFLQILILSTNVILKSQCLIDLEDNRTFCSSEIELGNTELLLNELEIENGIPPYSYEWSCDYWAYDQFYFSASDFLNDTTISNPILIQEGGEAEWMNFKLKITDSIGNTCSDNINIRFSSFSSSLINAYITINQGDTTQFPEFVVILGGIPPLTYYYTPEYGLSDPYDFNTLVYPDTSTTYHLNVIDSVGCLGGGFPLYSVYVNEISSSNNEISIDPNIKVYPNPVVNFLNIELNINEVNNLNFELYGEDGRVITNKIINRLKLDIDLSKLKTGTYFYRFKNDRIIQSGTIYKN